MWLITPLAHDDGVRAAHHLGADLLEVFRRRLLHRLAQRHRPLSVDSGATESYVVMPKSTGPLRERQQWETIADIADRLANAGILGLAWPLIRDFYVERCGKVSLRVRSF